MNKYELELIHDNTFGGKGEQTYKVNNYDGNVETLKEYVEQLNKSCNFWVSWRITNKEKGILEKEIDPLD